MKSVRSVVFPIAKSGFCYAVRCIVRYVVGGSTKSTIVRIVLVLQIEVAGPCRIVGRLNKRLSI